MIRTNLLVYPLTLGTLAFGTAALPTRSAAQWSAVQSTPTASAPTKDTHTGDLKKLEPFLASHPRIAKDLKDDPTLASNPDYLAKHPALQKFASQGSGGKSASAGGHHEFKTLDEFLDARPLVADELRKNPGLLDDHTYVAAHSGLQQFLKSHPEARQQLQERSATPTK